MNRIRLNDIRNIIPSMMVHGTSAVPKAKLKLLHEALEKHAELGKSYYDPLRKALAKPGSGSISGTVSKEMAKGFVHDLQTAIKRGEISLGSKPVSLSVAGRNFGTAEKIVQKLEQQATPPKIVQQPTAAEKAFARRQQVARMQQVREIQQSVNPASTTPAAAPSVGTAPLQTLPSSHPETSATRSSIAAGSTLRVVSAAEAGQHHQEPQSSAGQTGEKAVQLEDSSLAQPRPDQASATGMAQTAPPTEGDQPAPEQPAPPQPAAPEPPPEVDELQI